MRCKKLFRDWLAIAEAMAISTLPNLETVFIRRTDRSCPSNQQRRSYIT
jgi:hypothetical protein